MRCTNTGADCSFIQAFTASTASCSAPGTTVETQGLYGLCKLFLILVSDDVLTVVREFWILQVGVDALNCLDCLGLLRLSPWNDGQ